MNTNIIKNKSFMLLFIGSSISKLGDVLLTFSMGYFILQITGSSFQSSLYMSCGMIVFLIFQSLGGYLADKWDKVKIIWGGDYCRGVVMFVSLILFIAFPINSVRIIVLYVAMILINLIGAVFTPAAMSLIPRLVKEDEIQQANSLSILLFNSTNISGIILGQFFFLTFGPVWIFILNFLAYVISGFFEMFIVDSNERGTLVDNNFNGFEYIKKSYKLTNIILIGIFVNFLIVPFFATIIPYSFTEIFIDKSKDLENLNLYLTIASFVTSITFAFIKVKNTDKAFVYILFADLLLLLLSAIVLFSHLNDYISYNYFNNLLRIFLIGISILNTLLLVLLNTKFMKSIQKEYLGRVLAIYSTLLGAVNPISISLFGFILDVNPLITLFITFIMVFIFAFLLIANKTFVKIRD